MERKDPSLLENHYFKKFWLEREEDRGERSRKEVKGQKEKFSFSVKPSSQKLNEVNGIASPKISKYSDSVTFTGENNEERKGGW